MAGIDPQTGVPLLGTLSAQEQMEQHIASVIAEKSQLEDGDHDWVVGMTYALSEADAQRAAEAAARGETCTPPIRLAAQVMIHNTGSICRKCAMPYLQVADLPCPNMTFEEYLASLDPAIREQVIERLQSGDVPEGPITIDEESGDVTPVGESRDESRVLVTDSGAEIVVTEDRLPFPQAAQ
jgi:hypothetical protein